MDLAASVGPWIPDGSRVAPPHEVSEPATLYLLAPCSTSFGCAEAVMVAVHVELDVREGACNAALAVDSHHKIRTWRNLNLSNATFMCWYSILFANGFIERDGTASEFLIGLLNELACWALAPGAESFFRSLLLGRIWMRSLFECSKSENQAAVPLNFLYLEDFSVSSIYRNVLRRLGAFMLVNLPRRKLQPKQ
ncbi:hypothetical protein ZEAMMB73_Zm00001d019679 [Zea mays]|uniref:Uncharacterized protein n=1 Tax=Zea mays TaxID=4577 RepID=A0A1D6HZQ7_MAIZE|nr:hypothetical protein ZEAMMB73_Zm00001d019679 [Zea mays]